jgi:hypothetical protein
MDPDEDKSPMVKKKTLPVKSNFKKKEKPTAKPTVASVNFKFVPYM